MKSRPARAIPKKNMALSAVPASASTGAGRCYLLELPRELRDEIFSLVINGGNVYFHPKQSMRGHWARQPALARTCRQIRHEALLLYDRLITFTFYHGPRLPVIPDTMEYIRDIEIDCRPYGTLMGFAMKIARGLEDFEVSIMPKQFNALSKNEESEILEEVRGYLVWRLGSPHRAFTKDVFRDLLNLIQRRASEVLDNRERSNRPR